MERIDYIRTVLSYIEKNLPQNLSPEFLAAQHFVSLSQLYRDFYACTGHSIKEYIRKRRMSNACAKLKSSNIPLSIIVDESGYQTQQAFNKQFKNTTGMTPLEYKESSEYYYFYPFINNETAVSVKVGTETLPQCSTARFYDSCLAGIEDRAIASLGAVNGRVFGRNGKQIGILLCYELMTEVSPGIGPGTQYATCVVNYHEDAVNNGWNYLYNTWLPGSMFEESGTYFEEYLFSNGKPHKLKLYLPVKKRKAEQHISILNEEKKMFIAARETGYNAEHKASEKVIGFLQKHYPLMLRNTRRFYVRAYGDVYECGIACGPDFAFINGSGLAIVHVPADSYAVLPCSCLGDIFTGAEKMEAWLRNNSILHENEPVFAVYETAPGKYDTAAIKMKLYKRLKNDKN